MLHVSWWKTTLIWFAVLLSVLLAVPNLLGERTISSLPSWWAHRKIGLGLDLRGGSHLLLKIERDDIEKDRLEDIVGDIGTRLRTVNIAYSGLTGTGQKIELKINDPAQIQAALTALRPLTAGSDKPAVKLSQGDNGAMTLDITNEDIDSHVAPAGAEAI